MTVPKYAITAAAAIALVYFARGALEYWDPEMLFALICSCGTILACVTEIRRSGSELKNLQSELDTLSKVGPEGWIDLRVQVGILAHRLDSLSSDIDEDGDEGAPTGDSEVSEGVE